MDSGPRHLSCPSALVPFPVAMSSDLPSPMSPTDGALDSSPTQNRLFIISPAGYSNLSDDHTIPLPSEVAPTPF